jgi:WD40 repeat protein
LVGSKVHRKLKTTLTNHSKFVNCVRFSPNGEKFLSVGSDKLGFLYDGKTGEKIGQLDPSKQHSLSIYACSWSPDNSKIVTCSSDKTLKIWNADGSFVKDLTLVGNTTVDDQQLGVLWLNADTIISVVLDGRLIFWNPAQDHPVRIQHGHNRPPEALAFYNGKIVGGGGNGEIILWNPENSETEQFTGTQHVNKITGVGVVGDNLYSVSFDDTAKFSDLKTKEYGTTISLGSPGTGLAVHKEFAIITSTKTVYRVENGSIKVKKSIDNATFSSCGISPDGKLVAVGTDEKKIYLMNPQTLDVLHTFDVRGQVTSLNFDPTGKMLLSTDSDREVFIFDVEKKEVKYDAMKFHGGRVNCGAWSPDGKTYATVSGAGDIIVWEIGKKESHLRLPNSHVGGVFFCLWIDNNTLITSGNDAAIKIWTKQ